MRKKTLEIINLALELDHKLKIHNNDITRISTIN